MSKRSLVNFELIHKRAVNHLKKSDPIMKEVISKVGNIQDYYRQRTHFMSLCRIIAGQQLSYRASSAIWARVIKLAPEWTPSAVSNISFHQLRKSGLSGAKSNYILDLSKRIFDKQLNLKSLETLDDSDAVIQLRSINGVGPWSIEMFMMFSLRRPDIFSTSDAGLRRAIIELYSICPDDYISSVTGITDKWMPYRSYACRYLWRWLDL